MIFSKLIGIFTFNNNCARALVELGGGAQVGLPVRCKSHNSKQPIHDWWLTSAQMLIWHCDQSSQHIYMSAQKWIWHSAVSNQSTHQTNQHIKPNNTLKTFNSYRSTVPAPYQTRFMNTTHTVHFYSQPAKYPLRSALGMEALKQDSMMWMSTQRHLNRKRRKEEEKKCVHTHEEVVHFRWCSFFDDVFDDDDFRWCSCCSS